MRALLKLLVLLVVLAAGLGAVAMVPILQRGISTRDEPTWFEVFAARQARHLAIPRAARDQSNPTRATPEVMAEARAHFADHCALCHANNGSGDTEIGRSLYPRAPDMRKPDTQQLSDGELFAIIERGVRLTGMPAWGTGTPEGVQQSWHLVHLIRHLPSITPDEIAEMERLNPKSPDEMKHEDDIERFLSGADAERPKTNRSEGATHHD